MPKFLMRCLPVGHMLSGFVLAASVSAAVAADYPDKPIRIVVPFPAGVSTDIVARTMADAIAVRLGQSVIVDNKAGADGVIGVMDVARAKPDGYTLLIATNGPLSAAQHLKKSPPYDVLRDLTPISDIGRATFAVYVSPRTPAKTLPEFIAYAKAHPGKLNYASGNLTGQLAFAQIAKTAGLDMTHVPYKGETNAMNDMFGGHADAIIATLGTGLPMVKAGKLRILAVLGQDRNPEIPEVPTLTEAGVPAMPIQSWFGMMGPARMPTAVVQKVNRAVTDSLNDPAVIKRMHMISVEPRTSTPDAAAQVLRTQLEAHGKAIRDANLPLN
ncbi:Bug family tripartite tricarboxylate transporter substrate binding protein [Cupriavidus basilensis]|uniref:Bug family tripartite tricarboxylate transporter substrate binding protein n=1 Tax=Cupriavidus basilensis TaxID=68895 RepID=UPI0023E7DE13|nr:tripartite tricarboxylate transporter substrate binding protein [Cupriavidus basilensis]MDF3883022.1 tripartite tricarboxylate transporter substrate binding protein [Cupriavidus basilensis]